jgi:integrase
MAVFKRNGAFYIDYYVGPRRIRERVGPTKGDAHKALAVRQAQIVQGKFGFGPNAQAKGNVAFKEFAERYGKLVSIHKRSYASEVYRLQTLNGFFGKYRLGDLRAEDAEKFKMERCKTVQPATVNRELGNLKNMMAVACKWSILERNPFAGVKLLHVPQKPERVLSGAEEVALLAACDKVRAPHLRPIIILALNTGMRKGEILSLEWPQVDPDQRMIRVLNSKSEAGQRSIPMNGAVHSLLSTLPRHRGTPLVFPSHRNPGQRMRDHKVGFLKAVRLAGIPHIRFHDLRHTFATRLVRAGADIITVQRLLGHAKISMTARYAHSLLHDRIAAVKLLDTEKAGGIAIRP